MFVDDGPVAEAAGIYFCCCWYCVAVEKNWNAYNLSEPLPDRQMYMYFGNGKSKREGQTKNIGDCSSKWEEGALERYYYIMHDICVNPEWVEEHFYRFALRV